MSKLIELVIKYRRITLFLVLVSVLAGCVNYYQLPRQEMPDITAPVAIISAVYPGASPEEVEKLVTSKIEDKVVELEGYDYANSYSYSSYASVVVRLKYGTDYNEVWQVLRQQMDDLQKSLPEQCQEIEINTDVVDTAGIILSVTGEDYSYEELYAQAERLKRQLSQVEGVTRFEIDGKQEKEVQVILDYEQLNFNKLSLSDIVTIIKAHNIEIPAGQLQDGATSINIKTTGSYQDITDIGDLIVGISETSGAVLQLKDLATLQVVTKDGLYKASYNDQNAVLLTGYFQADINIIFVGQAIDRILTDFTATLPAGLAVHKVIYQPDSVQSSVNKFVLNLIEGILFVIVVVFIGMGLRNAIIVSTAIPVSIMLTFLWFNVLGIQLHTISIAALIVALGMLVDNAIVVSDAIQNRLDQGSERLQACVQGVQEVATPVLTSTLTTVAAFSPLLVLNSIAGEFMRALPLVIIISLFASYVVALFVTPAMAYIFFRKRGSKQRESRVRALFDHALAYGMSHKLRVTGFVVIIIAVTIWLSLQIGLQFFPYADKDIIYIDIFSEEDMDLEATEMLTRQVTTIIKEMPEIDFYAVTLGGGLPKFYTTVMNLYQRPDFAQILLKTDLTQSDRYHQQKDLVEALQYNLDTQVVGGKATVKQLELAEPIGSPVRVRVTGSAIPTLQSSAQKVEQLLSEIPGTINVKDDFKDWVYEYQLIVDPIRLGYYGMTNYDVQNELSIALSGREASVLHYEGEEWPIVVKSNIKSLEELKNYRIKSSFTSQKAVLKDVASVEMVTQIPAIKKYNQEYTILVTSDLKNGYVPQEIEEQLDELLQEVDLGDVQITYDGEQAKIRENFGNVGYSALVAVVLVFLILLFQFKSFLQPLIILVTIPLSVIGSICGLYLLGQPLSFTALLGMVSLMGIVVNNAIILLDYINRTRSEGIGIAQACQTAAAKRLRPILLSTTTTFIGMIPLLFSGSDLFRPLAIALMFGLLVATLLTLVVIPLVYQTVESSLVEKRQ